MPNFHETKMGNIFFEGRIPRIVDALEKIAEKKDARKVIISVKDGKIAKIESNGIDVEIINL